MDLSMVLILSFSYFFLNFLSKPKRSFKLDEIYLNLFKLRNYFLFLYNQNGILDNQIFMKVTIFDLLFLGALAIINMALKT